MPASAQQPNPNPSIANYANMATMASGIAAAVSILMSAVFVFGIYKTKLETLENNIVKVQNDVEKLEDDMITVREKIAAITTAVNINLYGKPSIPTSQTTTP